MNILITPSSSTQAMPSSAIKAIPLGWVYIMNAAHLHKHGLREIICFFCNRRRLPRWTTSQTGPIPRLSQKRDKYMVLHHPNIMNDKCWSVYNSRLPLWLVKLSCQEWRVVPSQPQCGSGMIGMEKLGAVGSRAGGRTRWVWRGWTLHLLRICERRRRH